MGKGRICSAFLAMLRNELSGCNLLSGRASAPLWRCTSRVVQAGLSVEGKLRGSACQGRLGDAVLRLPCERMLLVQIEACAPPPSEVQFI